jgi:hypothetical protein
VRSRCTNSSCMHRRRCWPNRRPRRPNRDRKPRWLFHHLTGHYPTRPPAAGPWAG